jgi:hypothetical protein
MRDRAAATAPTPQVSSERPETPPAHSPELAAPKIVLENAADEPIATTMEKLPEQLQGNPLKHGDPAKHREAPPSLLRETATLLAPPVSASPAALSSVINSGGLPPRALQTVAQSIVQAAAQGAQPPASVAIDAPITLGQPGPVRVITLRLDLPDHGALNLRLSLADRGLTVRVVAEREETAHHLRHDQQALVEMLRHADYDTTITAIEVRRTESLDGGRGMQGTAGQPPAGGNGNGAEQRAPEQRPRGGFTEEGRPLGRNREEVHETHDDRRAHRLYV